MKKTTIALLSLMLSASIFSVNHIHAEAANQPFVIEGKVVQGRTLVPVRYVAAGLGAEVNWNQQSKTVTILNGKTEVMLKMNSNKVMQNGTEITIDVPAQITKGVTYIPIRFISQTLGGTISWDAESRVADVSLGDKQVRITTESTFNLSTIPQGHINTLIQKANEATKLSSYSQIRAHFKSNFTGTFINKIIKQNGLEFNVPFTGTAYSHSEGKEGYINQYESPLNAGGMIVERRIILKQIQNTWMVDDIIFSSSAP
ncbi:copper amine oxidase N-terminal domain-containing protein [Paenibacillus sp. FSL K6-3182]|uniref:copper amine oxidase N-terminal domain-containing protein n=1 Tax=Paenibacillus sp. FSL K6-3182 TaxID=2921495 RepID=UPI0030CD118C